jgi:8-hydroxy-5-deazaflavin:NADPH oxidoreductase
MKIGILGGGGVGQTLGAGLIAKGHDVLIGIRAVTPAELAKDRAQAVPLADWQKTTGARVVTLAEAAAHGEIVINATSGQASLEALAAAGAANLAGKVLIDVANPLDFSHGMPPFVARDYAGPTSLGEQIQAAYPDTRVVKAFNTIAAAVMTNPGLVPGAHDLLIAGNSAEAKATVAGVARDFGWQHIVDLGDIVGARATEAHLALWVRLWTSTGTPMLNIHVARA